MLSAAERSAAFEKALDTCVEKLGTLEEHLSKHAYCCGDAPGLDDIMRFVVLQILFVNLGELWGFDAPLYARLPHMKRWLLAMRGRDSNPFKHVHDDELYYRAHREWWTKKMPERLFPSVAETVARLRGKSAGSGLSLPAPASVEMRLRVGPAASAVRGAVRAERRDAGRAAECGAGGPCAPGGSGARDHRSRQRREGGSGRRVHVRHVY